MTRTDPAIRFAAGTLVVLVGAAASGKSTLAARYPLSWRVCLDAYREAATDDMADQSATPTAAQIQALILDARLSRGLTTVVDSTAVHAHYRAGLLARARYWNRPAHAVLFDVPLTVCEARNTARPRTVPRDILRDQHRRLPTADQLRTEGFDAVHLTDASTTDTH
ncbi:AAA family ATPase [Streptomyces sp. NPDC057654]|uniref:AAA family ATPase n=1 Tax=Streptomyces sp. NPDC057654 TaxID=3346196 RepID=UPI0036B7083F